MPTIDLNDVLDVAIISGAKIIFTGPAGPYLAAIVGIAVGTAIIEKWLVKKRKELAAKGVKFLAFMVGGLLTVSLVIKACRHTLFVLR